MEISSLAAAYAGAQTSKVQTAVAANMLRMNAQAAASIVKVLEAAQANMQSLAETAAGVGGNLDISV